MVKTLSEIIIYPVKSLGGISVNQAEVTDRGLKYDRRWMLLDENYSFLSQRKIPQMALINCELKMNNLEFTHTPVNQKFTISITEHEEENLDVKVWDDDIKAKRVSAEADEWFSNILNIKCSLVYMPDESKRPVDNKYAHNNELTSLSDGYPFLIIGQSSLDDLNSKLTEKIPTNRFRPNFVFTGGIPFEEDEMKVFMIGGIKFFGVKQCDRCIVTTINQETAEKGDEPLRTLSSFRTVNNKVMFGMNLIHEGKGFVHVGDKLQVINSK